MKESMIQARIIKYLKSLGYPTYRIHTQGIVFKTNTGYRLTKNPARGMSDLVVFAKNHTLWIEVKSESGKLSEDQHVFKNIVDQQRNNQIFLIARSVQDVTDCLKNIQGG